jgi:predicted site-specific integrase-resolvase
MASVETETDLLTPTPVTGHLIGYARTSRRHQNLDRQINALTAVGCKRIYQDQLSGKDADRPGLTEALDHLLVQATSDVDRRLNWIIGGDGSATGRALPRAARG